MEDKNTTRLHQAITQLPTYKAPDSVWKQLEEDLEEIDTEQFPEGASLETHCKQVRLSLEDIEYKQESILQRAIKELPQYQAGSDVFEQIIGQVDKKAQKRIKLWYGLVGVAASVSLLIGFFWLTKSFENTEQIQISYSQETVHLPGRQQSEVSDGNDEVLQFINEHCLKVAIKCQEPQFKGLVEEYMELQAARKELESQIQLQQTQPELIRYLVRVEKQQTEVGKKLIQHLLI